MSDKLKSHYEVEDIPPGDLETQIALFEQATATVKGSAEAADDFCKNAEKVLGQAFDMAHEAGNMELARQINDLWDGVQRTTVDIHRQGAVIQGSKGAVIESIKQRDRVLRELKDLSDRLQEWQDFGVEKAQERLAGMIALAIGVPRLSIERVISVVLCDKETIEEGAMEEFLEAFANLDNALYVEEMFKRYADVVEETEED